MLTAIDLDVSLVDEFFHRQWTPLKIRYTVEDDGHYEVFDADTGAKIQVGWISPGGSPDEVKRQIFENVRDGMPTVSLQGKALARYAELLKRPEFSISAVVTPEKKEHEGRLITEVSLPWIQMVETLSKDWSKAQDLTPTQWEELVAEAYKRAEFDEVVLTPRSGDHGRDVIAIRHGVGSIKIIGSVKAYKPGLNVSYDHVRALIGVMTGERDVSKGIITTTSDFPPKMMEDPFIAPFVPYRLELMNGVKTQQWLKELLGKAKR